MNCKDKSRTEDEHDTLVEELFTCVTCKGVVSVSKEKFEDHLVAKHKFPRDCTANVLLIAHGSGAATYTYMLTGTTTHDGRTVRFNILRTYKRAVPR